MASHRESEWRARVSASKAVFLDGRRIGAGYHLAQLVLKEKSLIPVHGLLGFPHGVVREFREQVSQRNQAGRSFITFLASEVLPSLLPYLQISQDSREGNKWVDPTSLSMCQRHIVKTIWDGRCYCSHFWKMQSITLSEKRIQNVGTAVIITYIIFIT